MNIKSIINEEINKYIINENVNSLMQYTNGINKELNKIKNYTVTDRALQNFIKNFEVYCIQVIHAVNRCVKANNLNEGLSNWGINIPPELGGNFWNDAKRGYYKTKNFLTRGSYGNNGMRNDVNPNTVPSVKLSVLMQQFPQKKQECDSKNAQMSLYQQVPPILTIVQYLEQIYNEYNNLLQQQQQNNAQGTNP
jgi:hypothetical protein